MRKQAEQYIGEIGDIFNRILELLYNDQELSLMMSSRQYIKCMRHEERWVNVQDFIQGGHLSETDVLMCLLWLQAIGRISITDVDLNSGGLKVRTNFLV